MTVFRALPFRLPAACAGLLLCAAAASAQDIPGNAAAGKRFSMGVCAECHMVAVGQSGLYRSDAPPFPDIANLPSTTVLSLRVFLQTPHAKRSMPDLVLTEDQMDDVIAYILSLRN